MKNRIIQIIKDANITKTEFAKRIEVSQAFVSQMCSGAYNPSPRTISVICREFNIRREWLETGEGPMRYPQPDTDMELINALLVDEPAATVRFVKRFMRVYLQLTPDRQAAMDEVLEELSKQK